MEQSKGTVVFFSMDALGHIHPSLSIIQELRRRGYRAIILTTRPLSMADRLKSQGFELDYCEVVTSSLSEETMSNIMEPLMEKFRQGPKSAFINTYALEGACGMHIDDMERAHDIIETKLKSLKPDLIVVDHIIGIPCTTTVAPKWVRTYSGFPSTIYSSYNENYIGGLGLRLDEVTAELKRFEIDTKRSCREKVRRFFSKVGAPDWPLELDLSPTSPHLNFYLGPQELGLDRVESLKPLPKTWFRLEHTIDKGSIKENLFQIPDCLLNKPGKLIYFSLGTLVTSDVKLINRLLEVMSRSPNRFIVSMGVMHEKIKLYPNMWGDKFLDQKAILPKCDLFITHGGHNSIIEAFYFGVPGLLVLPVFADQFDAAQRIQDCGFGLRLNPFDCSGEKLLEAIESLLANDEVKLRMQSASKRLQAIMYHELAVDEIEKLLRT